MAALQDRRVRVAIGRRGGGPAAMSWTDLRVEASVRKTIEREPNEGRITIYNLAERSRTLIDQEDAVVFLYAGYGPDEPGLLFVGDVQERDHERRGADWLTVIEAGDGEHAFNNAHVSLSLRGGSTVDQAVRLMQGALAQAGVDVDEATIRSLPVIQRAQGYSFEGRVRDALDELTDTLGYTWSIQNGRLRPVPAGYDEPGQAVLLTPSTGLIGTPKRTKDGWEVTALLQPGIEPHRVLEVRSAVLDAFVRVRSVAYDLDTHGTPWYATAEVETRA